MTPQEQILQLYIRPIGLPADGYKAFSLLLDKEIMDITLIYSRFKLSYCFAPTTLQLTSLYIWLLEPKTQEYTRILPNHQAIEYLQANGLLDAKKFYFNLDRIEFLL